MSTASASGSAIASQLRRARGRGARRAGAVVLVEIAIRAGLINRFIVPLPRRSSRAIPRIIVEENVLHRFLETIRRVLWASLLLAAIGIPLGALPRIASGVMRLRVRAWVGALAAAPIVLMYPLFLVIFGRSATTIVDDRFRRRPCAGHSRKRRGPVGNASSAPRCRAQLQAQHPRSSSGRSCCPAALPSVFVGLKLGLIFAMINIVGVEFLIDFGGLGQLINELAERYDLPGTYGAICFVILTSVVFFDTTERLERFLRPRGSAARRSVGARHDGHVAMVVIIIADRARGLGSAFALGLAFSRCRPIAGRPSRSAIARLLAAGDFYSNLGITVGEIAIGVLIGGLCGLPRAYYSAPIDSSRAPTSRSSTISDRHRRSSSFP